MLQEVWLRAERSRESIAVQQRENPSAEDGKISNFDRSSLA